MEISGRVHRFEDNIDTDVIIPARYCSSYQIEDITPHCMQGHPRFTNGSFHEGVAEGDVIVADENFGCGSSREVAPLSIKGTGIALIVARSFARIFYRNAINIGLPILVCPECAEQTEEGDTLEADLTTGVVKNTTKGLEWQAEPFPEFIRGIIAAGGLMAWIAAGNAQAQAS